MTNEKRSDKADPKEIIEISKAVAETLKLFNNVLFEQQQSIAALASGICHEMINLVRDLNSVSEGKKISEEDVKAIEKKYLENVGKIENSADKAGSALKQFLDKGSESEVSNSYYKAAAFHALSNACHNAVTAQQQSNVIAQAAVQQGVVCLYSVISASIGIVEKK